MTTEIRAYTEEQFSRLNNLTYGNDNIAIVRGMIEKYGYHMAEVASDSADPYTVAVDDRLVVALLHGQAETYRDCIKLGVRDEARGIMLEAGVPQLIYTSRLKYFDKLIEKVDQNYQKMKSEYKTYNL